jgi:hypothetical protein
LKLTHLESDLRNLGAHDLDYLKLIEETDLDEIPNIKPLEKRMLIKQIQVLKSGVSSPTQPHNDVYL